MPMTTLLKTLFIVFLLAGCVQTRYLTQDPPAGGLKHNEVVLVDDGSCPTGQIKQLTGGNMQLSIPRQSECINQPE